MNLGFDEFVNAKVATGRFWLFEVGSVEWQYVLTEIGRDFFPDVLDSVEEFGAIIPDEDMDRSPVYWALKSKLPAAALTARLGLSAKQLNQASLFRLKPYPDGPVESNVYYYGRA